MQKVKLTPKKVAMAIGVSESSMKRWCDRGLIEFYTTAGGHRRISQASVVEFLRSTEHRLIRSEMIGLPEGIRAEPVDLEIAARDYLAASLDNHEDSARKILLSAFLSGHSIAALGDSVISPSFNEIGRQWQCENLEVYRERRACELTTQLLSELRGLLPVPTDTAPLAIGGAPESDVYNLPNTLIEMVLREKGWRTQSLGSMLPFSTLAAAAWEQKPRLFWLTISSIANSSEFVKAYTQFQRSLSPDTFLVVGGSALDESIRRQVQFSAYGDNLRQLETLAVSLKGPSVTKSEPASPAPGPVTNY